MQRTLPLVLLAAALFCAPAQAGSGWLTNLEKGKKAAKAKKLPILVEFTGSDWCTNCKALEKEVFKTKAFQKEQAKRFVLVQLDYPQKKRQDKSVKARNKRVMADYKVEGFPTVLLLDYEGKEIGRAVGYQSGTHDKWRAQVEKLLSENFDPVTGKAKPGSAQPGPAQPEPASGSETWSTDHAKAAERARASDRPLVVFFTGSDWCTWCKRLEKEVFETAAFKAWAKDKVVLLELDFPSRTPQSKALREQNKQLAAKYQVEGFPTVLILDPAGKVLGSTAYVPGGPKAWIAEAEKALATR